MPRASSRHALAVAHHVLPCRPIADIRAATSKVHEAGANVLISVGGGSPIDAAKTIAYTIHQDTGRWIPSIAVPTTLSVAETTQNAGYKNEEGHKVSITDPEMCPKGMPRCLPTLPLSLCQNCCSRLTRTP